MSWCVVTDTSLVGGQSVRLWGDGREAREGRKVGRVRSDGG